MLAGNSIRVFNHPKSEVPSIQPVSVLKKNKIFIAKILESQNTLYDYSQQPKYGCFVSYFYTIKSYLSIVRMRMKSCHFQQSATNGKKNNISDGTWKTQLHIWHAARLLKKLINKFMKVWDKIVVTRDGEAKIKKQIWRD